MNSSEVKFSSVLGCAHSLRSTVLKSSSPHLLKAAVAADIMGHAYYSLTEIILLCLLID